MKSVTYLLDEYSDLAISASKRILGSLLPTAKTRVLSRRIPE